MSVVRRDSIAFVDTPNGNAAAPVATASRGGATAVSLIRQRQAPGGHNPAHWHDREEVMTVLAGAVDVTIDGALHTLETGDTIVVPAEAAHQVRNTGSEPAEWLLVAPAGYRFYRTTGEDATPDWAR